MQALFLNTPELIDQHWPDVARLIQPVVDHAARGEFAVDDLGRLVKHERAFAGVAIGTDGPVMGMVFEFIKYPKKTFINVIALGGQDLSTVTITFWPQFIEWAKQSGASGIEASTSPAMTRVLKGLGLIHTYDLVRLNFGEAS